MFFLSRFRVILEGQAQCCQSKRLYEEFYCSVDALGTNILYTFLHANDPLEKSKLDFKEEVYGIELVFSAHCPCPHPKQLSEHIACLISQVNVPGDEKHINQKRLRSDAGLKWGTRGRNYEITRSPAPPTYKPRRLDKRRLSPFILPLTLVRNHGQ